MPSCYTWDEVQTCHCDQENLALWTSMFTFLATLDAPFPLQSRWNFYFIICLFGWTGSRLWYAGSLVAAFELSVAACGISVPDWGWTQTPWSLSHWTTRGISVILDFACTYRGPHSSQPQGFVHAISSPWNAAPRHTPTLVQDCLFLIL